MVRPEDGADARPRDTSRPILLVGFLERGNLGLGYIASVLQQHGYRVLIMDFEEDPDAILATAHDEGPLLVGFSVIFQFHIERFRTLAQYLRHHGIEAHFTAGGHFPSLSYEHTLNLIPELDSVVRFEGEFTALELADQLSTGSDWRGIRGIAFRRDESVVATPPRPLMDDLDELPYPVRDPNPPSILGCRVRSLLASRGCARRCSFCSIHMFYRSARGRVVRTRRPAKVAEEMRTLLEEEGVRIFVFQDDDFPLFGPVWRRWAEDFVGELHRHQLPGQAIWKISCRVDSVDPDLFATLRDAGLYLVFLGLESGTDPGLAVLNKGVTVEQNLRAVSTLKRLGLNFEFGFMLIEPSSTFDLVRENVRFLRAITGDGSAGAVFCRLVPFDGTPIKEALAASGRLRGDVTDPEYDFLDPGLEGFFADLERVVHRADWIFGPRAVSSQLNYAWTEAAVLEHLFPRLPGMARYKADLRVITKVSNETLFHVVDELADLHEDHSHAGGFPLSLEKDFVALGRGFVHRLLETRNGFVLQNQDLLLRSLGAQAVSVATE